jgi:hypothetical protein
VPPETCPNCGADLPRNARACPDCGSDDRTGWSDRAGFDRLEVPDPEDFDRDTFYREEFGLPSPRRSHSSQRQWIPWVGAILLIALVWWWWPF